jgi:hypothetical protein
MIIKFNAGTKTLFNLRGNSLAEDYNHEERIYAAYGSIIYTVSRFDVNAGVRAEKSVTGFEVYDLKPEAIIKRILFFRLLIQNLL